MTAGEHAKSCVCDAIDILEHLTTDDFGNGKDRPARELLVEAVIVLGSDAAQWADDYPHAVALARSAPIAR